MTVRAAVFPRFRPICAVYRETRPALVQINMSAVLFQALPPPDILRRSLQIPWVMVPIGQKVHQVLGL